MTPDSFSDGGHFFDPHTAQQHAIEMVKAGASIIDVGAESTRPGAMPVSAREQISRLSQVVPTLATDLNTSISIDTTSAEVADWALQHGVSMINDISGLRFDPNLAKVVAKYDATLVVTHSRETPLTMQHSPVYANVVDEVVAELNFQIEVAIRSGVKNIVIDPGIGFAKRLADNLTLLREIPRLAELGYPVLIGTSRKSMISQITGESDVSRLAGSLASALWAVHHGASILRVHDVLQTQQALMVWSAIQDGPTTRPIGQACTF